MRAVCEIGLKEFHDFHKNLAKPMPDDVDLISKIAETDDHPVSVI